MFELMNEMLELVYVADVNTYELLFMNTPGKVKFGIEKLDDLKCYKVLQGLNAPCPFCTNAMLSFDKVYNWEFNNPFTNRHYLLKDKLIHWEGRTARIEIAIDDTESQLEKIALKNALEAEEMVMECAKQLYQTSNISETIQNVLVQVGTFLSADRTYIFDIHGNKMSNTMEWCAKGIHPQINNLQDLSISLISTWMSYFNKHECVIIENLETLKENDKEAYYVLAQQGIHSLVAAPLENKGILSGYIGVDNPPEDKIRNISPLFHTLGYFLMSALLKAEDEQLLTKLSYYDTLTGFYNRNRYIKDTDNLSQYKSTLGIVYMDINGLKDINDLKGHFYGDQILILCAKKIAEVFKTGDFYRIGGDEFIVICKSISKELFKAYITTLRKSFENDKECHAAIGYQWEKSVNDIQEMISKADIMMYKDKEQYYSKNSPSHRYRRWE